MQVLRGSTPVVVEKHVDQILSCLVRHGNMRGEWEHLSIFQVK